MLRKGIVALMIGVMSVGTIQAEDVQKSNRLMEFFRGPQIGRPSHRAEGPTKSDLPQGGVTHAVVADADRQIPDIRQTSSRPEPQQLQPADSRPQPTPGQYHAQAPQPVAAPVAYPVADPTWSGLAQPQYSAVPGPVYFVSQADEQSADDQDSTATNGPVFYPAGPRSLYPAPQPGIPAGVGGSLIVTDAFHPHEMMHAHRYRAMYGPYYYKVNGCWMVTPFGVWSKENWKLQGTTVDVKYKSHISPFAMFKPPVLR